MPHRAALSCLLLLLSACGALLSGCGRQGGGEPFADSRVPPSVAPRFYPPEGWAWGMVKVGDAPAQRYGVATPPVAPKATVLILSGYDDPAEVWFETVRDLTRKGYAVWLLERAGQGGSGRSAIPRDLGHATSFAPDVAGVRALLRTVIRPTGDTPVVILGHSLGGLIAVQAVQAGVPADGLILSAPTVALAGLPAPREQVAGAARTARTVGLGWVRAPGQHGWRRDPPAVARDPVRQAMRGAWSVANPDLRMGGPSLGWLATFHDAAEAAQRGAGQVKVPTLLIAAGDDRVARNDASQRLCQAIPDCRRVVIPQAWHDLPREPDSAREPWLEAVDASVKARIAAHRRPPVRR